MDMSVCKYFTENQSRQPCFSRQTGKNVFIIIQQQSCVLVALCFSILWVCHAKLFNQQTSEQLFFFTPISLAFLFICMHINVKCVCVCACLNDCWRVETVKLKWQQIGVNLLIYICPAMSTKLHMAKGISLMSRSCACVCWQKFYFFN